ncbi:hypothetical protein CQ12_32040 [Bradyrhizobium jicamae]|uniref:Tryptophan-rich domain-containing protein n=1 Tax=Bradyrhizobium jicamae TaxID=280332 RepID=A0A0R3LG68_9BRAD|nr:hypothetical protein CQ12_32040 [Bradyrhizobium jicamae]
MSGTDIESFGSTKLVQVGNNYYLASVSGNSGPELKCYGAPVVVGQFGAWTPIGTEQTASGYQVVLKYGTADSYIVWSVDSSGNYITNTAPASGGSSGIVSLETSFQQDLNGDGAISAGASAISQMASTTLGSHDAFRFRADFGEQGGGTGSVWLTEFLASYANLDTHPTVLQAGSLPHVADAGQDAIVNVFNHDDIMLRLAELPTGFFILH